MLKYILSAKKSNSSRPPSSHPGPGSNWPSTTPNKSDGDRGNAKK